MSATVTIRLESELKQRLEQLAESMQRSKSFLAAQAIRDFVDLNEWQVQEIEQAIVEADRGEFASDQDVAAVFDKWGVRGG
ncbi:MAG: ribbon-helix-helix protein, CopG family [Gammaproteobacteria bacterium]|nr:CopG family ribbon-helix-helix protein [Gammaproteobacteria bacterium]MYF10290.1 ribbon-helix-helix protein, CopG family [Gammaproteobacteria bacterium]MYG11445.1 ribbon-helix-helix protein, CopG family [Gammaproteobacteria bacterium]MYG14317.1 ribbon-helix-helix protein, CopG family [Gammaproteobacteria bacterium]